ncbi:flagellar basal body-associated FliL family protein [Rhodobacter capsulatus]|uniref:Flagellar protein FliL n=1 Tax=Rhodobacter capsulatus TaxID=1061 RepID=A0A1G7E6D2_RHOCA|nr:flagellar basal body-associated FliL family protein [Rhodobacter capsulatus]WER09351.1 flagellar basal body-associated FliL family protein [Rhodobacter capsulatus]SDE59237.1 flagellar FliL protein [Rhodobacter capsulatus]
MAEPEAEGEEAPKKKSKLPILIGLVLMLLLGGGAFYAVYSGMILAPAHPGGAEAAAEEEHPEKTEPQIAFVALDPMVISLTEGKARHLRFSAQLEVPLPRQKEVELLKPRVMDVLNGFLRAVEVTDLEDPAALLRLRAQMLRRVQIVVGEGMVNDLLVIEFVMN